MRSDANEPESQADGGTPAPGDGTLSAAESARLIAEQRAALTRTVTFSGAPLYFVWGGVWLIGYGAMWAAATGWWPRGLPKGWAGVVMAAVMVAGMAYSAGYVFVRSRGVRGRSARLGTWYGLSWMLGFAAMMALGTGMERAGASSSVIGLYYTISPAVLVGIFYIFGGLAFEDRDWSVIGVIIVAVTIMAALTGSALAMLIMSLAGGGVLIAGGACTVLAARRRRTQL